MGIITDQVKRRYPLTITDLSKTEMKNLTDILMIDNPARHQISRPAMPELINVSIKEAIKMLPSALRRNRIVRIIPSFKEREAKLCDTHNGFNPYIIGHLCDLVKAEVEDRMRKVDKYADQIHESERMLLRSVQALRRLWGEVPPDEVKELGITYPFPQGNGCEACILARIAKDPGYLRNLRMALVSRTKTGRKQRVPRLLAFADGAINCHSGSELNIARESNHLAADFKLARKVAAVISGNNRQSYKEEVEKYLNRGSNAMIDVHLHPALCEEYLARQQQRRPLRVGKDRDSARTSKGKNRATRDTIADDIIPLYEQMSLDESPARALKASKSSNTQHNCMTLPANTCTLDPSSSRARHTLTSISPSEPCDNNANALATDYRHAIGQNAASESDSVYSQCSVNNPVGEPSPPSTTWSLMMEEAENP